MRGFIGYALRRYKGIEFYHTIMEAQSIPGEYDRNNPTIDNQVVARATNKYFGWGDVMKQCLRGEISLHDMCKNAFEHIEIDEFLHYAYRYFNVYNGHLFFSEDKVDYGKEYTLKELIDIFIDQSDYYANPKIYEKALDEYYNGKLNWRKKYKGKSYTQIYCEIEETGDRDEIHKVLTELSHYMAAISATDSIASLLKLLEPGYRTVEIDDAIRVTNDFKHTYLRRE